MSNESRRTLVVDLDSLHRMRAELQTLGCMRPTAGSIYASMASVIDKIIEGGTTVDMDHAKVAGFAQALVKAQREREGSEITEFEWMAKEREQEERYYSEAQSVDAEWMPSGGAA